MVPVWRIWPNWIDPAATAPAPKAKARPQSGAASSSASPPQPPTSNLVFGDPTGVWAEVEMDLDETAPSCRPPTRSWADVENDPNVEMEEVE